MTEDKAVLIDRVFDAVQCLLTAEGYPPGDAGIITCNINVDFYDDADEESWRDDFNPMVLKWKCPGWDDYWKQFGAERDD